MSFVPCGLSERLIGVAPLHLDDSNDGEILRRVSDSPRLGNGGLAPSPVETK